MPTTFSILSWNVCAFRGGDPQLSKVADHLRSMDPDVFGLFEVESVDIVKLMQDHLPGYDYFLTDGPENKEILVGVRRGRFEQSVFTQKREFKAYNPSLRPGALLSLSLGGIFYSLLFLHTDSGTEAPSFGNRNEMFAKIWSLKKALDKQAPDGLGARFATLGDLNTMGLQYPSRRKGDLRVSGEGEVAALGGLARRNGMVVPVKEFPATWAGDGLASDLDHVLATENLVFKEQGEVDGHPFYVKVTGWQQLQGAERKRFLDTVSDHCSLYCEVG
jgi:hypothetical protein